MEILAKPSPLTPLKLLNSLPKLPISTQGIPGLEVSKFMVNMNIHHTTDLYDAAENRRKEGQVNLRAFAMYHKINQ